MNTQPDLPGLEPESLPIPEEWRAALDVVEAHPVELRRGGFWSPTQESAERIRTRVLFNLARLNRVAFTAWRRGLGGALFPIQAQAKRTPNP